MPKSGTAKAKRGQEQRRRDRKLREELGLGPEDPLPILRPRNNHPEFLGCAIARKRAFLTVEDALAALLVRRCEMILDENPTLPVRIYRCTPMTGQMLSNGEEWPVHYHQTSIALYVHDHSPALRSPLYWVDQEFDRHTPVNLDPEEP